MFFKNFWPALLWAIVVFVLSAIPGNYFPSITSFWDWLGPDKIVHLAFYALLSYLVFNGMHRQYSKANKRLSLVFLTLFIGTVFGLFIEIMQYYVFVGRSGNLYDFIANVIGCVIGVLVYVGVYRKKYFG